MSAQQNKTIEKYQSKNYDMTIRAFKLFVQKNVELNGQLFELMQQKINEFQIEENFTQHEFRILLRLIGTLQNKQQQVKQMSMDQIQRTNFYIHYKSKKKQNTNEQNKKSHLSQEIIKVKQPQKSLHNSERKEIQYPSVNYKMQSNQIQYQQLSEEDQAKKKQFVQSHQVHHQKPLNKGIASKQQNNDKKSQSKQQQKQKARITQYEKFSTDYVNTVIKFRIQYQDQTVLRRYSQFEKLMKILGEKFEGYILPEMPPKQGIKSGMSYFWGVDQSFLQDRKKKLEQLLNRLLESKFFSNDQTLHRFLTDASFQIQFANQGYAAYLKTFTDIVFNAKQLKDYGLAYCNYLKQKGNVKLNPIIQKKYEDIQEIIKIFADLNEYRKKINVNFDKRKQILIEQKKQIKNSQDSDFNKIMNKIQDQIKNLGTQFGKYRDLKSRQSWIKQLIRQKTSDGSRVELDLTQEKKKLQNRLQKMQKNLSISLDDFNQSKREEVKVIGSKMLEWRRKTHP